MRRSSAVSLFTGSDARAPRDNHTRIRPRPTISPSAPHGSELPCRSGPDTAAVARVESTQARKVADISESVARECRTQPARPVGEPSWGGNDRFDDRFDRMGSRTACERQRQWLDQRRSLLFEHVRDRRRRLLCGLPAIRPRWCVERRADRRTRLSAARRMAMPGSEVRGLASPG